MSLVQRIAEAVSEAVAVAKTSKAERDAAQESVDDIVDRLFCEVKKLKRVSRVNSDGSTMNADVIVGSDGLKGYRCFLRLHNSNSTLRPMVDISRLSYGDTRIKILVKDHGDFYHIDGSTSSVGECWLTPEQIDANFDLIQGKIHDAFVNWCGGK